jgi:hypothetical protein
MTTWQFGEVGKYSGVDVAATPVFTVVPLHGANLVCVVVYELRLPVPLAHWRRGL